MPMLGYPAQVAELEKIARLTPAGAATERAAPGLGEAEDAPCLVCGRRPARACGACGSVHYCSAEHQRVGACWPGPEALEFGPVALRMRMAPPRVISRGVQPT
jgi:hypothetical protein